MSESRKDTNRPPANPPEEATFVKSKELPRLNYDKIVGVLGIDTEYIIDHEEVIVERLFEAAKMIANGKDTTRTKDRFNTQSVVAINQCIHLASSFALLGSSTNGIDDAKELIQKLFPNKQLDGTTVITVAMLARILDVAFARGWTWQVLRTKDVSKIDIGDAEPKSRITIQPELCSTPTEYINVVRIQLDLVNWMVGADVKETLFKPVSA